MELTSKSLGAALLGLGIIFGAVSQLGGVVSRIGWVPLGAPPQPNGVTIVVAASHAATLPMAGPATASVIIDTEIKIINEEEIVKGGTARIVAIVEQYEEYDLGQQQNQAAAAVTSTDPASKTRTKRDTLKWPIKVTASGGAFDWDGVDRTIELPAGTPIGNGKRLVWTPLIKDSAKDRVQATVTIENVIKDPAEMVTSQASVTRNGQPVPEGERDGITIDFKVLPNPWLTEWQYQVVCGILALISFIGAAAVFGFLNTTLLALGWKEPPEKNEQQKGPESVRRTPQERRADRGKA